MYLTAPLEFIKALSGCGWSPGIRVSYVYIRRVALLQQEWRLPRGEWQMTVGVHSFQVAPSVVMWLPSNPQARLTQFRLACTTPGLHGEFL